MKLVLNLLVTAVLLIGCQPKEVSIQEITSLRDGNQDNLVSFSNLVLPKILGKEFKRFESGVDADKKNEFISLMAVTQHSPSMMHRTTGKPIQNTIVWSFCEWVMHWPCTSFTDFP